MTAATDLDTRRPADVELGPAWIRGGPGLRLMVILRAPGCRYALRTGGCTNCGFQHLTTRGVMVPTDDLLAQLDHALAQHAGQAGHITALELFCSGSFLCDEEVPAEARQRLLDMAVTRLPALRRITVESRPEYVIEETLAAACATVAPVVLELAIGLETVDDAIRLRRIRKGFTLRAFEEAATRIAQAGAQLVAYLLLKPMGTNTDREAVADVVHSARYLLQLRRRLDLPLRVALEPTFVPRETPLWDELQAGRYCPPSLWAAVDAARRMAALGLRVHVGLSSEGLPAEQIPSGCPRCTGELRRGLARFNETQEIALLNALSCTCRTPQQELS